MKRFLPIVAVAALVSLFTSGAVQTLFSALADQSERVPPTSGIFTGIQFSGKLGDAFRSVSTGNKGSSAPANVGGTTVNGLEWLDDTTSTWIKKRYVNGNWAVEGAYVAADSTYVGVIGGGAPVSIASGATVDLGSVPQANITITGTTTVTGFGSAAPAGVVKFIRFDNALILTHSASILVPGAYSLTTAANDRAIVTHLGSGNWEITQYTRANGTPIDIGSVGKMEFTSSATVPAFYVRGDGRALSRTLYPAYLSKVTLSQNGTRTSGNATITGIADTTGLGAGMPVESTGVNPGCTISSVVTSSSIVLNSSSCVTSSGTSMVTVFLTGYGTGGSSSTVGVRDCRGRALAGRDHNDPGSYANRLTPTYFGSDSVVAGTANGSESTTLSLAQLPTGITSANASQPISVSPASGFILRSNSSAIFDFPSTAGSGLRAPDATASMSSSQVMNGNNSISVTSTNTSGSPHRTVQPTLIAECVVRVTP